MGERSYRAVEPAEPFTFVVGADGVLRPAPRRSEHVACAEHAGLGRPSGFPHDAVTPHTQTTRELGFLRLGGGAGRTLPASSRVG